MKSLLKSVVAYAAMCGMLSAEAAVPKVVVTDTVRDAEGHPTAITVAFQGFAAGKSYPLYLFCGADDAGNDTNAWAYVERLDDIAPGETARTIQPPECYCREYYTIRFAASCPIAGTPDTGSYVQDDLEVMWDAIENVAPGVHDATTNVWTDLTGHGFDWNINLNNASWTDDGLVINPTGTAGTIRNGKQPADLYQKVKTLEFVYENADNTRAGILLGFGFGRTAYLYTANNGHVGYYDYKGQAVAENKTYCYSVAYTAASETANTPNGVANCWLNGQVDLDDGMNDYWGPAGSIVLNGRNGTPYAKGTLRAVRIYSRVLTDDERMENFVCDSARFLGATEFFAFSECVKDTPVWLYDATAKTITNAKTGWKITVSASGRNLTLGARDESGAADPTTLDLTGLVADANMNVYSITTIPEGCFKGNATLADITLPLTLKSIGKEAFYNCAVERIGNFLPPGLTYLGSDAFSGCTKLASPLVMGDLCVGGGNWRFYNCRALPSAVIGASFTKLENNDFANCFALTNVVLPNTLTSIGASTFAGCTALRRVEPFLPASVTRVGSDAFSGCTALESPLVLGQENAVSFDSNMNFKNCPKIPSISLGTLGSALQKQCFYGCTGVKSVYLSEQLFTQTDGTAFSGWTAYQSRWIMPKDSEVWMDIATNSTDVTALTPEEQATYDSLFSDSYDCVGTIAGNFHCAKQWLVKPSDHEKFYAMLEVVASPDPYAADKVEPAYGNHNATDLLPIDCSAPEYHAEPSVLWRCTGYVLEKKLDETHYELVEDGAGKLAFTFNPTEAGDYRLTWNWTEGGYRAEIPAFFGESCFEVTTDVAPTAEGFYPLGTEVTYTVRATGSAPFVRWYGDVGTNDPASATISILIDGSKRIMPYFETPWRLSADKKSITDGYWSNSCSVAANGEVTFKGRLALHQTGVLDLTKPIEGEGYSFVRIDNGVFYCGSESDSEAVRVANNEKYSRWGDFRVKLPETLREIGNNAFQGNRVLVSIEPFFPKSVSKMGDFAFNSCTALRGDLVIDPDVTMSIAGNKQFLGCSKLDSMFLGKNVTWIPDGMFNGCSSMTNAVVLGPITAIYGYTFHGCTSLRRFEPCLPAMVTTVGDEAFSDCPNLESEIAIGWAKNVSVSFASNKNFARNPKIPSVKIGPAVQNLQKTVFWQSKGVKDVWIGGEYPNFIGDGSMEWNTYQARIHLPRGVASVEDYIASSVTPWTNLSESVQAVYTNAYPGARLPIGLTKGAVWPNQWAVRWSSPWLGIGTQLILR